MHALISVAVAVLLQTPGLSLSPIDAAMFVQRTAPGHGAHRALRLANSPVCPCPARREGV